MNYALIPVDTVLLTWADEIVCTGAEQALQLAGRTKKPVRCFNLPDRFAFKDPELIQLIRKEAEKYWPGIIPCPQAAILPRCVESKSDPRPQNDRPST